MVRRFLLLTLLAPLMFVVSVAMHNLVSAVLGGEEPIFFLLAVLGAPTLLVVGLAGTVAALIDQAVQHRHAH